MSTGPRLEGGHSVDAKTGGVSVLLIENDAMVRAAMGMSLGFWGCRVLDGPSIEDVEQALRSTGFVPDIILTDLHLGQHDSRTAAELLPPFLARNGLDVPVIVMTGDSGPGRFPQVQNLGWGFLLKPFAPSKLHASIVEALDARSVRGVPESLGPSR